MGKSRLTKGGNDFQSAMSDMQACVLEKLQMRGEF